MRVPDPLADAFKSTGPGSFQDRIGRFATDRGLLPDTESLMSERFLSRSIAPHIQRLSALFNREDAGQGDAVEAYWREGSNPANLRLAYFLYFMPCNLFRAASVWSELHRLGFRWAAQGSLRAIEFGAGPAAGACGIATGERFAPLGLPAGGDWALIEQDKTVLELGADWAREFAGLAIRPFHRKISPDKDWLPPRAPRFNLWLSSFFLNELRLEPAAMAERLIETWKHHLADEGLAILIEPALKLQSRRLLELRRELIPRLKGQYRILLPCLGCQDCGALAQPEDWCHEEATWWRPPYYHVLDRILGLDRRTMPFSYLVIAKSKRPVEELLPAITGPVRHRLVSPAHSEGRDQEFFVCGQEGKRRARLQSDTELHRGDILLGAELRGDPHSSRVQALTKIV